MKELFHGGQNMRDKTRIPEFTKELERIWMQCYPDWRFGQFMVNFLIMLHLNINEIHSFQKNQRC